MGAKFFIKNIEKVVIKSNIPEDPEIKLLVDHYLSIFIFLALTFFFYPKTLSYCLPDYQELDKVLRCIQYSRVN